MNCLGVIGPRTKTIGTNPYGSSGISDESWVSRNRVRNISRNMGGAALDAGANVSLESGRTGDSDSQ